MSDLLRRRMQELLDAEPPDAALRARVINSLPARQHSRSPERWRWLQGAIAALLTLAIVAGLVYVGKAIRQQPVTPRAITLTQTNSVCTYDGPAEIDAGTVTIWLVNQSTDYWYVGVVLLLDNHQYGELAASIREERQRLRAGEPLIGLPSYAAEAANDEVPPNATLRLTATVSAGTYGMVCITGKDAGPGPADSISIVGPITVRSVPTGAG